MSETQTEQQQTEAQPQAGGATKLEDLLAGLDDDARKTVLGEVTKARSEARNLRERVRVAEPQLQELASLKAAQQTESERLTAQAKEQEHAAAQARRDALRFKVALEHGLTSDDLQFIHGDDEDSILASAEALRARLGQAQQSSNEPRAPRMDPSQGSSSNGGATPDPGQQFAAFLKREMGRQ